MSTHAPSVTDVSGILDELGRSKRAAAGTDEPCASAATMNFLVYVDDPAHRPWVLQRAVRVAEKHPSRLVIIDATRAGGGVEIAASAREASGSTILCERIDLSVGGLDHGTIGGVSHDLCLPGINTVLWWTSADVDQNDTFVALMVLATNIVLDSSGSGQGADAIRELAAFHRAYPDIALRDLAFMRLAPWQDMIAQFFDDPALFADVFSLTRLEVDAGSDAEALYIAGWLGSRLSWTVCDAHTFCARDGRMIPLARTTRGERRRVVRVALTSLDATYTAELSDDEGVVRLSVGGAKAKPDRYAPLQSIDNASLIERAMLSVGPDYVFETSLETVGSLLAL